MAGLSGYQAGESDMLAIGMREAGCWGFGLILGLKREGDEQPSDPGTYTIALACSFIAIVLNRRVGG